MIGARAAGGPRRWLPCGDIGSGRLRNGHILEVLRHAGVRQTTGELNGAVSASGDAKGICPLLAQRLHELPVTTCDGKIQGAHASGRGAVDLCAGLK